MLYLLINAILLEFMLLRMPINIDFGKHFFLRICKTWICTANSVICNVLLFYGRIIPGPNFIFSAALRVPIACCDIVIFRYSLYTH